MIKNKHSNSSAIQNQPCEQLLDGLVFFTERPAKERDYVIYAVQGEYSSETIDANELFSLFTANIIKENVIFIR